MSNRTTLVGAGIGALGALLLAVFLLQPSGRSEAAGPAVQAFSVRAALLPGMTPEEVRGRVRSVQLPESTTPMRRVEDLDSLAGQVVLRPVGVGEILTAEQFSAPGPAAGGLMVPAGYEALTIEAEPAPGVGGYVTPGARVNVYVTVEDEDGDQPAASVPGYTQLVAGHLDVLAVTRGTLTGESQPVDQQAEQGKVVLLLQALPADVPVLIHAQARGALWFTLVNADDPAPQALRVGEEALQPHGRTAAVAAARKAQDAAREDAQ
jgi:pilus assembly protein CpaB